MMIRRTLVALAASLFVLPALAQDAFPSKPVRIVSPFPPGGTSDVMARLVAEPLGKELGQQVIVENIGGAGGTVGTLRAVKLPADGYTIIQTGVGQSAVAHGLNPGLGYDSNKDFIHLAQVHSGPNVLVVNASTPAKNLNELVALLKADPAKANYGSNGNGTAQHLIGTQFQNATGTEMVHIPYKGSGPLATDLLGGQIAMSFDTVTPVLPHIKAGKLRPLAVTTARRSSALPDVPTLDEAGLKGFNIGTWFGVLAPTGTPKELVARLNTEMVKVIQSPEFRKRMDEIGAEPIGNTADQMAAQIKAETEKFGKLVKEAKVVIE
jgi:tripartite-type tricarboxylate transporter receptor subunit TctC